MNRLRELREEKGISQTDLSKLWNAAPSSISSWESGTRQMDYETLIKVADFYGTSVDYIIGRNDANIPQSHKERKIIKIFRELPDSHKDFMCEFSDLLKGLFESQKQKKE